MSNYEICDIHGHYLPGVDDGCKHAEESAKLLRLSYQQGIRAAFATPHYYPVESVGSFLERRAAAAQRLEEQLARDGQPAPRICLGAEVAYRPGLCYEEDLEKLCLGNSRYILLELPFDRWGPGLVRDVQNICNIRGLTPILAHLERYQDPANRQLMGKILELDVLVQMNAATLQRFATRRKAARLLRTGAVQFLGTDCHNLTDRRPNMGQALEYLHKRGLEQTIRQLCTQSMELFEQAVR